MSILHVERRFVSHDTHCVSSRIASFSAVGTEANYIGQKHERIQSGVQGVRPPPLENYKTIGFLSNTGPDPLKITKLPYQHSIIGHHRPPLSKLSVIQKNNNKQICIIDEIVSMVTHCANVSFLLHWYNDLGFVHCISKLNCISFSEDCLRFSKPCRPG